MDGQGRRIDLRLGNFACSIDGFDDPAAVLGRVLDTLAEAPGAETLGAQGVVLDPDTLAALRSAAAEAAGRPAEDVAAVPGLVVLTPEAAAAPEAANGLGAAMSEEASTPASASPSGSASGPIAEGTAAPASDDIRAALAAVSALAPDDAPMDPPEEGPRRGWPAAWRLDDADAPSAEEPPFPEDALETAEAPDWDQPAPLELTTPERVEDTAHESPLTGENPAAGQPLTLEDLAADGVSADLSGQDTDTPPLSLDPLALEPVREEDALSLEIEEPAAEDADDSVAARASMLFGRVPAAGPTDTEPALEPAIESDPEPDLDPAIETEPAEHAPAAPVAEEDPIIARLRRVAAERRGEEIDPPEERTPLRLDAAGDGPPKKVSPLMRRGRRPRNIFGDSATASPAPAAADDDTAPIALDAAMMVDAPAQETVPLMLDAGAADTALDQGPAPEPAPEPAPRRARRSIFGVFGGGDRAAATDEEPEDEIEEEPRQRRNSLDFSEPREGRRPRPPMTAQALAWKMEAHKPDDQLIAAGAFLTYVERKPRFTRKEIFAVLDSIPGEIVRNLEVRIKNFGRLTRDGVFVQLGTDSFSLSDAEQDRLAEYFED